MLRKLLRPFRHGVAPARLLSAGASGGGSGGAAGSWAADEVEYLDEAGSVICSGRGFVRPVSPGLDSHFLVGDRARPLSDASAIAKIVELVRRWRWGPDMESHLGNLQFTPSPLHLSRSVADLLNCPPAALALLRWARRQPWYLPDPAPFSLLLAGLNSAGDFDAVVAVFDDIAPDAALAPAANHAVRLLAAAGRVEVSFHCFRRLLELVSPAVETPTFNAVIKVLLSKGLPYKAFELHESMPGGGADAATFNLLVPALARSGRLDTAVKLYGEMRSDAATRRHIAAQTFASLVDSLAKSGRLELALRVFAEMQEDGHRPSAATLAALIESFVKAGKLDAAGELWEQMKGMGFRPNFALYTAMVEANSKSGRLAAAATLFTEMERAGFLPSPATFAALIETHAAAGDAAAALRLSNSMADAGMRPGASTYSALLAALAGKKMADAAGQVLLEMKTAGLPAEIAASDVLMAFVRGGAADLGLKWLQFMSAAGVRANSFLLRQLFESCLRAGLYASARPLLEAYVGAAAKVDLVLYTSILAHLVRCRDEDDEAALMGILSAAKHPAHAFMCSLFSSPERRQRPALALVREFFQGLDYEQEGGAARYFVNVLLNYLVLMGQMNRARCVWKVAYEAKLFPKAIVFDQHIAWSLDVRGLSVGAAVAATAHTLHRFRKRMVYYGVVPRRIKLVAGPGLKAAVAAALAPLEPPFEVGKVVLRASGDTVLDWFKKPIVQQFLVNELPSKADLVLHRLDVLFPSSAPELRSSAVVAAAARRAATV
ncbi:pentatricopeptide repeat (PPR) superfamily protein [Wolffia australiana]